MNVHRFKIDRLTSMCFRLSRAASQPVALRLMAAAALVLSCVVPVVGAEDESVQNASSASEKAQAEFFEESIRPVLANKCVSCHGETKQEGGLRLDSFESITTGGESGAALAPGDTDGSLIIEALRYEGFEMPPSGQLDEKTIDLFEQWVESGAHWPASSVVREEAGVTDADKQWWAFQPVRRDDPPTASNAAWNENPIDQFVFASLTEKGIQPADQADESVLLRRVYFDIVGVPPTEEEIADYYSGPPECRWAQLVDKLLEDPRYGEHWARHWLDLVRYAESDGWNQDAYRPHIWRYRDYVIDAFNEDKAYPEFVRDQLAGDERPDDNPAALIAAGYLRLGIYEYNQRDARGHWNDIMNEMTDVTGDVFFGLSMSCARCHNHKFDPILQRDYFKLRAFFEPISWRDDLLGATEAQKQKFAKDNQAYLEATAELRAELEELERKYIDKKWESTVDKFPLDIQACFHMPKADRTSWQNQMAYLVERQFLEEGGGPFKSLKKEDKTRRDELLKKLSEFDKLKPKPLPKLMTATDFSGIPSPTRIPDSSAPPVAPGFLTVMGDDGLSSFATDEIRPDTTGRRTALAKWIGDADNPLSTRVIANRIWQQHFGRGVVKTSSDFGAQGARPTDPALLDFITAYFVDGGWKMKRLHRLILNSKTWKLSADHTRASEYSQVDPGEDLFWRWGIRRQSAEQIRDSMLLASGELRKKLGGPSVGESEPRRSIYVKSFRNKNDTFLHGFDTAAGLRSVAVRDSTTTPTQALLLINGSYALGRAKKMAEQLMKQYSTPEELAERAFLRTWGRSPTGDELASALDYMKIGIGEDSEPPSVERLADFCHILFNSNQFLYIE